MDLYKVLIDEPKAHEEGLHLFVKFMYAYDGDWQTISKIITDTYGSGYTAYRSEVATLDEAAAFLDGRVLGIEEGFRLLSETRE